MEWWATQPQALAVPPDDLHIGGNDVHVWRVQLDDPNFCSSCCQSALSTGEKDRATKFKFDRTGGAILFHMPRCVAAFNISR
jgi:hypothetical protein